ncbi:MAG: anti-sigma factor family protein [Acidobacteriaceae bacterium]
MTCSEVRPNLSALLDGELEGSSAANLQEHLASCAECRSELDSLQATVSWLKTYSPLEPPPQLANRVNAEIIRETHEARKGSLAPLLAALLFVLLLLATNATVPAATGLGLRTSRAGLRLLADLVRLLAFFPALRFFIMGGLALAMTLAGAFLWKTLGAMEPSRRPA